MQAGAKVIHRQVGGKSYPQVGRWESYPQVMQGYARAKVIHRLCVCDQVQGERAGGWVQVSGQVQGSQVQGGCGQVRVMRVQVTRVRVSGQVYAGATRLCGCRLCWCDQVQGRCERVMLVRPGAARLCWCERVRAGYAGRLRGCRRVQGRCGCRLRTGYAGRCDQVQPGAGATRCRLRTGYAGGWAYYIGAGRGAGCFT